MFLCNCGRIPPHETHRMISLECKWYWLRLANSRRIEEFLPLWNVMIFNVIPKLKRTEDCISFRWGLIKIQVIESNFLSPLWNLRACLLQLAIVPNVELSGIERLEMYSLVASECYTLAARVFSGTRICWYISSEGRGWGAHRHTQTHTDVQTCSCIHHRKAQFCLAFRCRLGARVPRSPMFVALHQKHSKALLIWWRLVASPQGDCICQSGLHHSQSSELFKCTKWARLVDGFSAKACARCIRCILYTSLGSCSRFLCP